MSARHGGASRLNDLPTRRVLAALRRAGWTERVPQKGKGHTVLVYMGKPGIVTVPRHPKVKKGLLRAILKQAGLSEEQFIELL